MILPQPLLAEALALHTQTLRRYRKMGMPYLKWWPKWGWWSRDAPYYNTRRVLRWMDRAPVEYKPGARRVLANLNKKPPRPEQRVAGGGP